MKMAEAKAIINKKNNDGFMVNFEWVRGGILESDHFPDKLAGEKLIPTEKEAWLLAAEFAEAMMGKVVNLYVIKSNFVPVEDYKKKYIKNR